ncbi:metallophosphoesterase [Lederbergia sp. NSJ-179]|uniref:metallophosphoesterase n=1 Tax=Lederbergia sp. NSJ-179 TaxID=2931402 RepID=UPI001FD38973|nr:metallophosphoesterase [Lederbergia sp. NSJ-179]MCJ7839437.1 metallophosphoesterase [Lederbergia sp. NSJ-179]
MGLLWISFTLIGIIGLTIFMVRNAFEDNIVTEELPFEHLPNQLDGRVIFFISDIHRRKVSDNMIREIKGKPDWIVIGGDLTEKGVPYSRMDENLSKLSKIAPVLFVWGNNDYEQDESRIRELFAKHHVKELKNNLYELEDEQLVFIGVDDITTQELPPIGSIFDHVNKDMFQIMISHNPGIMGMLPEDHHISLILSGHTHGGQIRVFGFGLYRKGSIRERNGITLLVSNGYGTSLLPLRLGAKPETHVLILRKG